MAALECCVWSKTTKSPHQGVYLGFLFGNLSQDPMTYVLGRIIVVLVRTQLPGIRIDDVSMES